MVDLVDKSDAALWTTDTQFHMQTESWTAFSQYVVIPDTHNVWWHQSACQNTEWIRFDKFPLVIFLIYK